MEEENELREWEKGGALTFYLSLSFSLSLSLSLSRSLSLSLSIYLAQNQILSDVLRRRRSIFGGDNIRAVLFCSRLI
jgi:hypothetical protein